MSEIEIYLDILKRLNYYLLDKRDSEFSKFYIMRNESLNDCEILSNKDGRILSFSLHNSSILPYNMYMYIDAKYAKFKSKGFVKIGDITYYMVESMNKKTFDEYYKEMFRKYKLINILDV